MSKDRYTVRETAEIAGVGVETVRVWIRRGQMKRLPLPIKPIYVSGAELERLGFKLKKEH